MNTEILDALLFVKNNEWNNAHNIAQSKEGNPEYDRLHAFLHRLEGDTFNAAYWYRRCKMEMPSKSLNEELDELIAYFGKKNLK